MVLASCLTSKIQFAQMPDKILSILLLNCGSGYAPMILFTSFPPLKMIMHGIPLTSSFAAISCPSSTLNFTNSSLLWNSLDIFSSTGPTILQGPHHGAQKSTRTGVLLCSTSFWNSSLVMSFILTLDKCRYYINLMFELVF